MDIVSGYMSGRPVVHCRNRWSSLLRAGRAAEMFDTNSLPPELLPAHLFRLLHRRSLLVARPCLNHRCNRSSTARRAWPTYPPQNPPSSSERVSRRTMVTSTRGQVGHSTCRIVTTAWNRPQAPSSGRIPSRLRVLAPDHRWAKDPTIWVR